MPRREQTGRSTCKTIHAIRNALSNQILVEVKSNCSRTRLEAKRSCNANGKTRDRECSDSSNSKCSETDGPGQSAASKTDTERSCSVKAKRNSPLCQPSTRGGTRVIDRLAIWQGPSMFQLTMTSWASPEMCLRLCIRDIKHSSRSCSRLLGSMNSAKRRSIKSTAKAWQRQKKCTAIG